MISNLTLETLIKVLNKKENKKEILKNLRREYDVTKIEELNEAQGMELLELLDDYTYHVTRKEHIRIKIIKDKEKLEEVILNHIKENNEVYALLEHTENCYVIAKKCKMIIFRSIENPTSFHLYEEKNDREFIIIFIAKTDDYKNTNLTTKLKRLDCKEIKINKWEFAVYNLEEIK